MTDDAQHAGRLLSRAEAAIYIESSWNIPCKAKTLAKLAVVGGGPAYRLAHHRYPRYAVDDLDDWARSRLGPKQRSTSEVGTATKLGFYAHHVK
jgi:hypothetical protein